jgi:hypothetical protein
VNHGVTVDVVCFALRPTSEDATFMISVAMHVDPDRRSGGAYWEEADAWAGGRAGDEWYRVEPRGGLENPDGRVFRYVLTGTEDAGRLERLPPGQSSALVK